MIKPASNPATADILEEGSAAENRQEKLGEPVPEEARSHKSAKSLRRMLVLVVLPSFAMLFTVGAGILKWYSATIEQDPSSGAQSVQAASAGATAMLSYQPDRIDQQLHAAQEMMTGEFRNSYAKLIDDVVIPGAKQKRISAVATVAAAASISATANNAVVLLVINQSTTIGRAPSTQTASSVRVRLEKIGTRWMISQFQPV